MHKRQLSNHVWTRWYRPPEIILLESDYDEKIDVWSTGWIFLELLKMTKNNVNILNNRDPLLGGLSCLPLSPVNPAFFANG